MRVRCDLKCGKECGVTLKGKEMKPGVSKEVNLTGRGTGLASVSTGVSLSKFRR